MSQSKSKSIYAKLAEARKAFHKMNLKKSGKNTFAGYSYFELADFIIPGMDCMREAGLVPVISFDDAYASMTIYDTDGSDSITVTSPMSTANLKAAHPVQNLGAVQTYMRRYLWMAALEIVEHDAVDASKPGDQPKATDDQVEQVVSLIEETGSDKEKLCEYFQVSEISAMTSQQAQDAIAMLNRKKAA